MILIPQYVFFTSGAAPGPVRRDSPPGVNRSLITTTDLTDEYGLKGLKPNNPTCNPTWNQQKNTKDIDSRRVSSTQLHHACLGAQGWNPANPAPALAWWARLCSHLKFDRRESLSVLVESLFCWRHPVLVHSAHFKFGYVTLDSYAAWIRINYRLWDHNSN